LLLQPSKTAILYVKIDRWNAVKASPCGQKYCDRQTAKVSIVKHKVPQNNQMFHKFRASPQIMKIKRHTEELNGFLQQEKTNNETTYLGLTITQLCRAAVRSCTSSKVKIRCVYGTEIQTAVFLSALRIT
jgi:hypothetical protein